MLAPDTELACSRRSAYEDRIRRRPARAVMMDSSDEGRASRDQHPHPLHHTPLQQRDQTRPAELRIPAALLRHLDTLDVCPDPARSRREVHARRPRAWSVGSSYDASLTSSAIAPRDLLLVPSGRRRHKQETSRKSPCGASTTPQHQRRLPAARQPSEQRQPTLNV